MLLRVLHFARGITGAAGVGLLAWPGFVLLESAYTQVWGERVLAAAMVPAAQDTILPEPLQVKPKATKVRNGSLIGRVEIPRISLSYVLLEGTDARTLDRSIGHVESTAQLGETGNIGIAGHRNTHFRKLEWVRKGDEVRLSSPSGSYRYYVEWARIFKPSDMVVLSPSHGPAVTLVTCFPFEYVGNAPLRFIVRALPDDETKARLVEVDGGSGQ